MLAKDARGEAPVAPKLNGEFGLTTEDTESTEGKGRKSTKNTKGLEED